MSSVIRLCLLSLALLLPGCAAVSNSPATQVDEQAVARVEQAAARAGVKVYWVHPPLKLVTAASK